MIQAIAIDDEPPALKIIENFCQQVDFISLQKTFSNPAEALKYLHKFPVSLVFLDIQMPSLSGIELARAIRQDTMVIFTTAFSEYAVEGFNLNAVDFLLKPFTFERFEQAVNKAREFNNKHHIQEQEEKYLFIRADYSLIKINMKDIEYIEGLDDYLKIHIRHQKTIVARMTMKAMMEKLPEKDFVRVHRSFIIPFRRIHSVRNKTVFLEGLEIPVGSSYEENFFRLFST